MRKLQRPCTRKPPAQCPAAVRLRARVVRCGRLLIGAAAAIFRKEKDLASLKLQKGKMLDKRRCASG